MENKSIRHHGGPMTPFLPQTFTKCIQRFSEGYAETYVGAGVGGAGVGGVGRAGVRVKEASRFHSGALQLSRCFVLYIELLNGNPFI